MAEGSLSAVLAAAGIDLPTAPSSHGGLADISSTIGALSRTIVQAGEMIDEVLPPTPANIRSREQMQRAIRLREPLPDLLDASGQETVEHAAATVATAIDSALVRFRSLQVPPASGEEVAGCEIADQAPALCVAGTGSNVITGDYALVVDLGGNDVHQNSAGGADTLENGLPVSVTIDLGGNDTYSTSLPTPSGAWIAQGGGMGGAGFLVDAAGDDSYRIASEGPFAQARGQGKSLNGVGLLADFGGNDSYGLDAQGPGFPTAEGQGDAAHGPAILLDLGGDDTHSIYAKATEFFILPIGAVAPPFPVAAGLGTGAWGYINARTPPPVHADFSYRQMGVGLFADAGGADTLSISAETPDPPDDTFFGPALIGLPGAVSFGVGAAQSGGVGLSVLGPGATTTSITTTTRAQLAAARSAGLGHGESGGQGVLSDAGGNDVRTLSTDVGVVRHGVGADGCNEDDCDAWARSDAATVEGMGSGIGSFGLGVLDDFGGADRYVASATNLVETTFRDERANGNAGRSTSIAGPVRAAVQGVGDGGFGELMDAEGDDRYEVVADSTARSTATRNGHGPHPEALSTAGQSEVLGQAAGRALGYGALKDLGGADVYITSSSTAVQATPTTEAVAGAATTGALASVDAQAAATFMDRDDGATDSFSTSPATAACTGTRGSGAWVDCAGAGFGFVG
jgi:hypothetical protein